jgi:signal peptidase II
VSLRDIEIRWVIFGFIIIFVDSFTKYFANKYLAYATPVKILSFLNLTLWHNHGVGLGLLGNINETILPIISTVVTIVIISTWIWYLPKKRKGNLTSCYLTLVLAGAISNLYDRLTHGYVTDFFDLHIKNYCWPDFNVADIAISIGTLVAIIVSVVGSR